MSIQRPPRVRLFVAFALAIVAALGGWFWWQRSHSLSAAAHRAWQGVVDANSTSVWDLLDPDEVKAYGLTKQQFQAFLTEYATPTILSCRIVEQQESEVGPDQLEMGIVVQTPKGATGYFHVTAARTGDGIICPMLLLGLLLECGEVRHPLGATSGAVATLRQWEVAATEDRAVLERLGIRGIYRSSTEGLLTWDQWIEHCAEGVRKFSADKTQTK